MPEVSLPWCVDYSKRGLLGSLFDKDQPIGKCRRDYLKLRADYRAGSVDAEEMVAKKGEYQQKLEEYFFPEIQTHATNVLIAGGWGCLEIALQGQ